LMYERGYHGTSLRDVAKVVGVQMSSLYYYHDSKQALLVDIMRTTLIDLGTAVRAALHDAAGARDRLVAGMRQHGAVLADRRDGRLGLPDVADQYCAIFLNGIDAARRAPAP